MPTVRNSITAMSIKELISFSQVPIGNSLELSYGEAVSTV